MNHVEYENPDSICVRLLNRLGDGIKFGEKRSRSAHQLRLQYFNYTEVISN